MILYITAFSFIPGGKQSNPLLQTAFQILDNERCKKLGEVYSSLNQQLCAGSVGTDICKVSKQLLDFYLLTLYPLIFVYFL